ncbi:MAG: bifunctional phosphopantothenoylcysteine decarboxylase/phosphopantothenate--cysteine ligase CoaBC [Sphaerochaetaceae bacterium]|nr:bifunctional phosphopantothenoylcysteine decarboxylase/phosphopantothenate--cysteine ligase CoaBC [Sphaerochaetaceae bacterium]
MERLEGKCIILGISGGIAAYKMANVASNLRKRGADVHVIMTKNAMEFITPLTFETLTGNKCLTDTFDRDFEFDVKHISLAKKADLILVAPASADIIAKLANGIADDMLTTTVLASKAIKLVAPSMNTAMLENPITVDNIKKLEHYGFEIIESAEGLLACMDTGKGKLPEPAVLVEHILAKVARRKDLSGLTVTVSAGPTQEAIDPVRFLTNRSSGKMGFAVAKEAMLRGAKVNLVAGPNTLTPVLNVNTINVQSAKEMFEAVKSVLPETDIIIMTAAVADYRPTTVASDKIKKKDGEMSLELERTDDILSYVTEHKTNDIFVCGFSMETKDLIENSMAKLKKKKLDMIVANNVKVQGAGFAVDTNVVTIITDEGKEDFPLLGKDEVAACLLDRIVEKRGR